MTSEVLLEGIRDENESFPVSVDGNEGKNSPLESMEITSMIEEPNISYQFDELKSILKAKNEFQNSGFENNFLKGGKWSPDGLCMLVGSEDKYLRLFELPSYLDLSSSHSNVVSDPMELNSVLKVKEGETIYDYCWFPLMNSMNPSTCFFLSSSRDHPIHLWDAFNGTLKSTYVGYDQFSELESAISLSFNSDGTHIYGGYDSHLKIFDTETCNCFDLRPKNKKHTKQKGILGSIAFYSTTFAVGSYSDTVALYDESDPSFVIDTLETKNYGKGVTQVQFTPDGNFIFAGMRKSDYIIGWDVRNTSYPVYQLQRSVTTNQKYQFDIFCDSNACYLVTPSRDQLIIYNLTDSGKSVSSHTIDSLNGCSFHPKLPLLLATSGERSPVHPNSEEMNVFQLGAQFNSG